MEEVFRTTCFRIGAYTFKIVSIVAGIGVTVVVLRPVRQAMFARLHARSSNIYRKEVDVKRREIFDKISLQDHQVDAPLQILDIGTSAVHNCILYPPTAHVTCVTTNVFRKKELRCLIQEHPNVAVEITSAEVMTSVPDGSIDIVVSTLGVCTARDVEKVLSEIKRVLKKGGRYYFLEHVAAKKLSVTSRIQKRYRLWWGMLFYGCTIDRKLSKILKGAGFSHLELEKFTADVDLGAERYLGKRLNHWVNSGLVYMIGPHVIGIAVK